MPPWAVATRPANAPKRARIASAARTARSGRPRAPAARRRPRGSRPGELLRRSAEPHDLVVHEGVELAPGARAGLPGRSARRAQSTRRDRRRGPSRRRSSWSIVAPRGGRRAAARRRTPSRRRPSLAARAAGGRRGRGSPHAGQKRLPGGTVEPQDGQVADTPRVYERPSDRPRLPVPAATADVAPILEGSCPSTPPTPPRPRLRRSSSCGSRTRALRARPGRRRDALGGRPAARDARRRRPRPRRARRRRAASWSSTSCSTSSTTRREVWCPAGAP